MPKPQETAVLIVNNRRFEDWETIWVQVRLHEGFSYFRFTAAERDDVTKLSKIAPFNVPLWKKLQFKPGDACTILLAGERVISGFIETRQVAYNANSHAVELIGKSATSWPFKSSVDTKTGSFDGMSFEQVARKVLQNYPVGVKVLGTIDATPFQQLQNQPGELIWDFLERIARPRGIILGADAFGNVLLIGQRPEPISGQLIEGKNIKQCQCVITMEHAYSAVDVRGQKAGTDAEHGPPVNEIQAVVAGTATPVNSTIITPAEQPITYAEVVKRAQNEAKWLNAQIFNVTVITQGWLADGNSLWEPGKLVYVNSPMIMCDEVMGIETVTFTQDNNNGTQTQIDMKYPWALNITNYDVGNPNTPTPGGKLSAADPNTVNV